ncbi:10667_t:CDS:10 [Diversispora eburnea]|uniref:isoleucine--tRNA ligase n=1 Tax=Diversispora eburnea TaxID=1213867 RepID=A0A9N8W2T6_9GLOM|nr:10667_t:CDS:10 [Diversispora eburnea]
MLYSKILRNLNKRIIYFNFREFSSSYFISKELNSKDSLKSLDNSNKNNNPNKAYNDTLLLPKTKFSLRADAINREKLFRDRCTDELYSWQLENNPKDLLISHDGPPYANGNLHIGHALNKILKDIINRYKILQGYKVSFIPGWDCHGLPIELKALSELKNVDKSKLTPMQIRTTARKSALDTVEIQKSEFKSWGIMGDWKNAYKTLDKEYEVRQLKIFYEMMKKDKISLSIGLHHPALAEAELEYRDDHQSRSVYVKLPNLNHILINDDVYVIIWTTTPWTLPANQAIAINSEMEYSIVSPIFDTEFVSTRDNYIVANKRLDSLQKILGTEFTIKTTFSGHQLIGTSYSHPITKEECRITEALFVNDESGTGLVHLAPGHGTDDYEACKKLNLSIHSPVDDFGKFSSEVGEPSFEGKFVLTDGTAAVIDYLRDNNILIKEKKIIHKYPYDWRTKKPIINRATSQWFANVQAFKQRAIESLANVKMLPDTARNTLRQYVLSRSEWCISRQRSWGVPIPVLYNIENDEPLFTESSIAHIIKIIEERGSDVWWEIDENELVAPEYKNNGIKYRRGMDTMDVWFDSGVSWAFILEKYKRQDYEPIADLYLEGIDQNRGWFQSSLLTSVAINNKAPYSTVITHGFVLDEKGRKMSKSLGNVVAPEVIIKGGKNKSEDPAYGVDVLRLWVASSEYVTDVNIGKSIMSQVAESLRRYRNSARFMLGNLNNFNHEKLVEYDDLKSIDKYILHELYQFGKDINSGYADFDFTKVIRLLNNFSSVTLSAFYFDVVKDRLYADHINSLSRRSVQSSLYHILNVYARSIAPVVPHLAEEIYENYKFMEPREYDSVFKLGWYNLDKQWNNVSLQIEWNILKYLRSEVNKLLEIARKEKLIKSSLEANVDLYLNSNLYNMLKTHDLKSIFITSNATLNEDISLLVENNSNEPKVHFIENINLTEGNIQGSGKIVVKKASFFKCPRCWNYSSIEGNCLCSRCKDVLSTEIDL